MVTLIILLQVVVLLLLIVFTYHVVFTLITGAPFVPTDSTRQKTILKFVKLKKGLKIADLGSGDGRLVIKFAQKGALAYGYEINPLLVYFSKKWIKKMHLEKNAFIIRKNFWQVNLKDFDVVIVYGMVHIMANLEKKLKKDLKPGSVVISNYFQLPNLTPFKEKNKVYFYKI